MYEDEYYDEDEVEAEEAKVEIEQQLEQQIDEKLTFEIPINQNIGNYIEAAVKATVTAKVDAAVTKIVDESVAKHLDEAIKTQVEAIVKEGLDLKVKTFDYSGKVTKEESFTDVLRAEMEKLATEGLTYSIGLKTDSYGRKTGGETISSIIQKDVYTHVSTVLKPKFEELEKNFKDETSKVLRSFTLNAVDEANRKVLRGF